MASYVTNDSDILISSFSRSVDELIKIACCVTTAFVAMHPTPHMPNVIINDYDDLYGNSVLIEFKHTEKVKH